MRDNEATYSRRKFLGTFSTGTVSLAAGMAAFVGVGFLYPVRRRKRPPMFVCLESKITAGRTLEIKDPEGRRVLLMRKAGGEMVALGTVCTHLGCSVYYRPEREIFDCPCHQGVFDLEGVPVSGPPREPLKRYPTEIRDGKVFIQFS